IQKEMYNVIQKGVAQYHATGGAGVLMDINSGEILSLVSYPSYNNNKFIGGISVSDFNKYLNAKGKPLNNKAIGDQVPPGSVFKTIVASAALDAGVLSPSTVYVSSSNYTFSNGVHFQEYHNHAYGALDLYGAISQSSNIYFCEVIRHWDMNKLVPYLQKFGIGQYTFIDIPGEGKGMLPSPENKRILATTTSPWLDPIWYPEGDSCNSVIGQGITTVTPIQMVNWIAAIANNGTLNTPHVGQKLVYPDGKVDILKYDPLRKNIANNYALSSVRYAMWSAVHGPKRTIVGLTSAPIDVAAKTGTAEFGRVDRNGVYEHAHAWVTGFFPYEKPKYAFVVFLEDGSESFYAVNVARDFIDWFAANKMK
ncbi:MAG TPA: penicillin-binding transpeptidase domain-containing protein, partial [Candidatus Dojkabacteria bacterium]|nr:penicillin-binding transpeptidase domain-containing protein [Candidatus Dojkabacteria bacterium]